MDYHITRSKVDALREMIRKYPPYDESSEEMNCFDGKYDRHRLASTNATSILKALGLSIDDQNDYGDIPE